jgi:hypothetical protein
MHCEGKSTLRLNISCIIEVVTKTCFTVWNKMSVKLKTQAIIGRKTGFNVTKNTPLNV